MTHFAWTRLSWHHAVPVAGVGLASHMPLIGFLREVTNVAQTRVVDNHTAPIRTSVLYSTKSEDGFALLPSMRALRRLPPLAWSGLSLSRDGVSPLFF